MLLHLLQTCGSQEKWIKSRASRPPEIFENIWLKTIVLNFYQFFSPVFPVHKEKSPGSPFFAEINSPWFWHEVNREPLNEH